MYPIEKYYNLGADLPFKEKCLSNFRIGHIKNLLRIFPKRLLLGLFLNKRFSKIPSDIRLLYSEYRSTPLVRARELESCLNLPENVKIYYKDESKSPAYSFKLNAAWPSVYYAKKSGFKKVICGSGAGQWGLALAYAANRLGLGCKVYMSSDSCSKKKLGLLKKNSAEVILVPGNSYTATRKLALEECIATRSFYPEISLELFQSIIGLETNLQLKHEGVSPDVMIGCLGGGSSLIGFISCFVKEKLEGKNKIRFISVESEDIPKLTKGEYKYLSGEFLLLEKRYTLGEDYTIPPTHVTGLRDVSATKLVSLSYHYKVIEAKSCSQEEAIHAGRAFNKTEKINPAPEATHAISEAIKEALLAKKNKEPKIIVFNLTGLAY